jgi:acyl carrier protein
MQLDDNIRIQIKNIVSEVLDVPDTEMTPTSLFKEDHDADSLGAIIVLAKLEKTFKISIPQTELRRMINLEGIYAVVAESDVVQ